MPSVVRVNRTSTRRAWACLPALCSASCVTLVQTQRGFAIDWLDLGNGAARHGDSLLLAKLRAEPIERRDEPGMLKQAGMQIIRNATHVFGQRGRVALDGVQRLRRESRSTPAASLRFTLLIAIESAARR